MDVRLVSARLLGRPDVWSPHPNHPAWSILPIDGSGELIPVEAEVHQHAFPAPRPVSGDTIELLYRSSSDPEAAQLRVAELTPDGALVRDGPVLGVDDIDGVRTAGYGNAIRLRAVDVVTDRREIRIQHAE